MTESRCKRCDAILESEEQFGLCAQCSLKEMLDLEELGDNPSEHLSSHTAKREGTHFAEYELLEKIAHGGMGVVYKARHTKLNRIVALKVVHNAMTFTPQAEARFRAEAEAAAHLDHPHIVPILEIGQEDGTPYFTMKLVEGGTLREWVSGRATFESIPPDDPHRQRFVARVMSKISQAVHHAHEHGILHRDIKPSNILLDAQGEPFVTDFGLAKRLDATLDLTVSGAVLGTPEYMSPEQASGDNKLLTTASDIYSLGAVLFYLLTGRPPFSGETALAVAMQVREHEATMPTAINPNIHRDLAIICLKCMQKDPSTRYASALALSQDLDRWLNGESIQARESTAFEKIGKWIKRRPAWAAMIVISITAMVSITWISIMGERRATKLANEKAEESERAFNAQKQAETASTKLNENLVRLEFQSARVAFESGDTQTGLAYLARVMRREPTLHPAVMRLGAALKTHVPATLKIPPIQHGGPVNQIEFSPDSKWIAIVSDDKTARVWDLETGKPITQPLMHDREAVRVTFSPNGRLLGTASLDRTARIWDISTGTPLLPPFEFNDYVQTVQFIRNGEEYFIMARNGSAKIWNLTEQKQRVSWNIHSEPPFAAFGRIDQNGQQVVAKGARGIFLWDVSGEPKSKGLHPQQSIPSSAQWDFVSSRLNLDASLAVTTLQRDYVEIWDTQLEKMLHRLPHDQLVPDAVFSPDGKHLATSCLDGKVRIWNLEESPSVIKVLTLPDQALRLAYNHDGTRLLVSDARQALSWWDPQSGTLIQAGMKHPADIWNYSIAISPDDSMIAAGLSNGETWVWKTHNPLEPDQIILQHQAKIASVRYSPNGKKLVTASSDRTARIWHAENGNPITDPLPHNHIVTYAEFSPDSSKILTASYDYHIRLFDSESGELLLDPIDARGWSLGAHFSTDGENIAAVTYPYFAQVWDVTNGTLSTGPFKTDVYPHEIAWNPIGTQVATASRVAQVQLWDLNNEMTPPKTLAHGAAVNALQFNRSGQLLLTGSADNTVRIWDVQQCNLNVPRMKHDGAVTSVTFSADEQRILSASKDNTARIWDAKSGEAMIPPLRHANDVLNASFGNHDRWIITAAADGTARLWDAATGYPITDPTHHEGTVTDARISPAGNSYVSADETGEAILRPLPPEITHQDEIPGWIPVLAEWTSGFRLNENNVLELINTEERDRMIQDIQSSMTPKELQSWGLPPSSLPPR